MSLNILIAKFHELYLSLVILLLVACFHYLIRFFAALYLNMLAIVHHVMFVIFPLKISQSFKGTLNECSLISREFSSISTLQLPIVVYRQIFLSLCICIYVCIIMRAACTHFGFMSNPSLL